MVFVLLLLACNTAPHSETSTLCVAARDGDAPMIRQLVARGADPNAAAGGNGWTPLLHAVHKHQNASVVALLDAGADVNRTGDENVTPLMMAAGYGYDDTARLLLQRGAKPGQALDWALTGVTDIDRFTFFDCLDSTVRLLHSAAPDVAPSIGARRWAKIKRCRAR